jgi:hypothetical protein
MSLVGYAADTMGPNSRTLTSSSPCIVWSFLASQPALRLTLHCDHLRIPQQNSFSRRSG